MTEDVKIVLSPGTILNNEVFEQVKDLSGNFKYVYLSDKIPRLKVLTKEYINKEVNEKDIQYHPLKQVGWKLCIDNQTDNEMYLENLYERFDKTQLWQDVRLFIYKYLDLSDEKQYDIITSWIFCTWISEVIPVVPYLFFYGVKESGKTKGLEILRDLCYRGILNTNISIPALYRSIEEYNPTLLIDESDSWTKEHRQQMIGILNSGYRKGSNAIRVTGKAFNKLQFFKTFGFKAIAGTRQLKDTLESRCIIIYMMANRRNIKLFIDSEEATSLRNRLLFWRLSFFKKYQQNIKSDGSDGGDGYLGGIDKKLEAEIPEVLRATKSGRLIELFFFLWKYADPLSKEAILEYALEEQKKHSILNEISIEAEIIQIIVDFSFISESNFIPTSDITTQFNIVRAIKDHWKNSSVGMVLRNLGFSSKRTNKRRGIELKKSHLQHLCTRYNIEFKLSKPSSKDTNLSPVDPSPPSLPSLIDGKVK